MHPGEAPRKSEAGPQNSGVSAGTKNGDAESEFSELVAMGLGNPFDQTVKAESAQLIGHMALGELSNGLAPQVG